MPTTPPIQHRTHPTTASNHTVSTRHARSSREVVGSVDNRLAERPDRSGRWAGRVSRRVGSPGDPGDLPLVSGGVRG